MLFQVHFLEGSIYIWCWFFHDFGRFGPVKPADLEVSFIRKYSIGRLPICCHFTSILDPEVQRQTWELLCHVDLWVSRIQFHQPSLRFQVLFINPNKKVWVLYIHPLFKGKSTISTMPISEAQISWIWLGWKQNLTVLKKTRLVQSTECCDPPHFPLSF